MCFVIDCIRTPAHHKTIVAAIIHTDLGMKAEHFTQKMIDAMRLEFELSTVAGPLEFSKLHIICTAPRPGRSLNW